MRQCKAHIFKGRKAVQRNAQIPKGHEAAQRSAHMPKGHQAAQRNAPMPKGHEALQRNCSHTIKLRDSPHISNILKPTFQHIEELKEQNVMQARGIERLQKSSNHQKVMAV